jgi:hypothetical protein
MKRESVINARAKLAASLPSTTEILRGSLLRRRIRHRSGCAVCARGKGHLVWVLTVSDPGSRNKQISLFAEQKPLVQQWLRNYQKLKATLNSTTSCFGRRASREEIRVTSAPSTTDRVTALCCINACATLGGSGLCRLGLRAAALA